jgi:menaquinol-cytochrome c reductase iron-sulfur subunit
MQSPMTRRHFFKVAFTAMAGVITALFSWPLFAFLFNPRSKDEEKFVKVPDFSRVPVDRPTKLTMEYIDEQAFLRQNTFYDIWVIRHSSGEVTVFSPLCTHLSCRYNWNGNEQIFACPCHGSVFRSTGEVMAGPAPRPLDRLPYQIKDGDLYVNWKVFKPGIHKQVEV